MHLKFCYASLPKKQSPAAMLKYCRLRKGLTTRQLAEAVGIVPATIGNFEREQFPIPYQTAVAIADVLVIDKNLLFDDFDRFLDTPYSEVLCIIRDDYKLSQKDFAEKQESLSAYMQNGKARLDNRQGKCISYWWKLILKLKYRRISVSILCWYAYFIFAHSTDTSLFAIIAVSNSRRQTSMEKLEKYMTDERTGLKYELVGDYYFIAGDDEPEEHR